MEVNRIGAVDLGVPCSFSDRILGSEHEGSYGGAGLREARATSKSRGLSSDVERKNELRSRFGNVHCGNEYSR